MGWKADLDKYNRTTALCVHDYTPTDKQQKAYDYCVKNDIRISPVAAEKGNMPTKWFVGVSDPKDYKKVYKSRFQYDNQQIWEEVYNACEYYYDKRVQ